MWFSDLVICLVDFKHLLLLTRHCGWHCEFKTAFQDSPSNGWTWHTKMQLQNDISGGGWYRGECLRRWVSLNPSNVSAGTAPRPGNTKPPPSQRFGLSLIWVWQMDKPRPFQTEGITHGDMEGRDSMAYWELEVIGCEWRAGHQKEVQSGSWSGLGLCCAKSHRLCLGRSCTGCPVAGSWPFRRLSGALSGAAAEELFLTPQCKGAAQALANTPPLLLIYWQSAPHLLTLYFCLLSMSQHLRNLVCPVSCCIPST